ncbi:MAG: site-specific integrase [Pseudobutyrivibrio sp.]|nr:site-specific integrase [Pseudobutyrivibrio sp.]
MAVSRKDPRGYALRRGESYRQDGRYSFSYTDKDRNRHTIYAKDLVSLRKREKTILRDLEDGLDPQRAERTTVNDLFDVYIAQKYNLKETTKTNYIYTYDHFVRNTFGRRRIVTICYTDVKKFYYSLMNDAGMKPATVENIHTLLHPSFKMAVRDGLLRTNPTEDVMTEIKKSNIWVKEKRHALTVPQQKAFMNYLYTHPEFEGWKPVITVLIGTGMRIGECLGLTWNDINMKERYIDVNHNITYRKLAENNGGCNLHINTPKTAAGRRTIPMIQEVYDAFLEEYQLQRVLGFCEQEIDGFSGFIFTSSSGNVAVPGEVNKAIHRIADAYNDEETAKARKEKREPLLLPEFSAHHLRHTFCTRFCENETNLKVIQSIMGHADISTTMDCYAEATEEKKQEVLANMENKIFIM